MVQDLQDLKVVALRAICVVRYLFCVWQCICEDFLNILKFEINLKLCQFE